MNIAVTRQGLITIVLGAVLGSVLMTALYFVFVPKGPIVPGMNGCIPPCPHTSVVESEDWTGHRWQTLTTVSNGTVISIEVLEEKPAFYSKVVLAGIGVAVGAAVGLWVARRRNVPGDGLYKITPT